MNPAPGDRRKRKPNQRVQYALNLLATVMLVVPMLIEPLKGYLPSHYYGILSSLFALMNTGFGYYQRNERRIWRKLLSWEWTHRWLAHDDQANE